MSSDTALPLRKVRCPGCGEYCMYSTENEFRPFCSARCKTNDFGSWASERFSVDANANLTDVESDTLGSGEAPEARRH